MLAVLLRPRLAVAVVFLAPLLTLGLTLGMFWLSGRPLTTTTALLPILVIVYTLGDGLHVYHHMHAPGAPQARSAGDGNRERDHTLA